MLASSSSFIPTPLAHAVNQGEGHPRVASLQIAESSEIALTVLQCKPKELCLAVIAVVGINSFETKIKFSSIENLLREWERKIANRQI
ncbi:hypothetical protein TNCV_629601 [Trichonephila clavipes]|nr:hypothetical protein TNCV_629601 [Trichonephila clavipes]